MKTNLLSLDIYIIIFLIIVIAISGCKAPPEGMVEVPEGEFIMGSDETDKEEKSVEYGIIKPWFEDEHPAHKVFLKRFYIDKHEVSNKEYKEFIDVTGWRLPSYWKDNRYPEGKDNHPVVYVNFFDASEYCKWEKKRLPSEAEWEKAARGIDNRRFPWGDEFDINKVNVGGLKGGTMPVDSYESGKSPFGIYNMIGNVWEWTSDWYNAYPDNRYKSKNFGKRFKVVKGTSWSGIGHYPDEIFDKIIAHNSRITFRLFLDPKMGLNDIGFRCVRSE
ncbi:MAG: formylglycine-generating enzyme family protein [Nitrospirota bacterium]